MNNRLYLILISLLITSCKTEKIDPSNLIGTFYHIEGSDDYNYLELKEDNTFNFVQAQYHSCEFWGEEYGTWEVVNNRLILNKGIDLDALIKTTTKKDLNSDTLIIKFSNDFLNSFPNIKARIGLDTFERQIINNQIKIDKEKYLEGSELFEYNNDDKKLNTKERQ